MDRHTISHTHKGPIMAQQFHGVIPPAVTPLTADQELDLPSFTLSLIHI